MIAAQGRFSVLVDDDKLRGEWSLGHYRHFHGVSSSCSLQVGHQLYLPEYDTGREKQEETGEEDGEENEEIDMKLVLSEENVPNGGFRFLPSSPV